MAASFRQSIRAGAAAGRYLKTRQVPLVNELARGAVRRRWSRRVAAGKQLPTGATAMRGGWDHGHILQLGQGLSTEANPNQAHAPSPSQRRSSESCDMPRARFRHLAERPWREGGSNRHPPCPPPRPLPGHPGPPWAEGGPCLYSNSGVLVRAFLSTHSHNLWRRVGWPQCSHLSMC